MSECVCESVSESLTPPATSASHISLPWLDNVFCCFVALATFRCRDLLNGTQFPRLAGRVDAVRAVNSKSGKRCVVKLVKAKVGVASLLLVLLPRLLLWLLSPLIF